MRQRDWPFSITFLSGLSAATAPVDRGLLRNYPAICAVDGRPNAIPTEHFTPEMLLIRLNHVPTKNILADERPEVDEVQKELELSRFIYRNPLR